MPAWSRLLSGELPFDVHTGSVSLLLPGLDFRNEGLPLANAAIQTLATQHAVPYTNNVSERHVRPSVIFRKVTNGFRSEWGAETYAAFRSLVSTAKANRASVLDVLRFVLAANIPEQLPLVTRLFDGLPRRNSEPRKASSPAEPFASPGHT